MLAKRRNGGSEVLEELCNKMIQYYYSPIYCVSSAFTT
jgi:hypothetical protein